MNKHDRALKAKGFKKVTGIDAGVTTVVKELSNNRKQYLRTTAIRSQTGAVMIKTVCIKTEA